MSMSNAEKQIRYRKKEALKALSDQIFRQWQAMAFNKRESPQEVMALLDKAAELPSRWTEEDLGQAEKRLNQLYLDLTFSKHDLQNDIHEASFPSEEFIRTPDPQKFVQESKTAISKAHALSGHLISAAQLTNLSAAEQAAAIMEVVRHVGRALSSTSEIPKSKATTVCLTAMPSFYDRPGWFLDSLANWLVDQLGKERAQALGKLLIDKDNEQRK